MRWLLRNQIVVPMTAVLLTTVLAVSVTTAFLAARRTTAELERLLQNIARTVSDARFPLTESVLLQMRGLSGAEFVLRNDSGRIVAQTVTPPSDVEWRSLSDAGGVASLRLSRSIALSDGRYFHAAVRLSVRGNVAESQTLHLFYPEANYQQAWRDAVLPPLLIGAVALAGMTVAALWIAARVSRPLMTLNRQVEQIADGQFLPMSLPPRDDEVRDLSQSVNRLAEMLTSYESEVRRSERLRTLDQLGGGIAHQLRNAVTGCRLAVDLHLADCPLGADDESLMVAKRQLALMETAIQRFLTLGQPKSESHVRRLDLVELINTTVPLVLPTARHAQVDLRWSPPSESLWVDADSGELEQLVVNLLLNALDAVTSQVHNPADRWVEVSCESHGDRLSVRVRDSGNGPSDKVRDRLFTPFVTDKPSGVGLGLAVAQEIARRHGGEVAWTREANVTSFCVDLPRGRSI